MLSHWTPLVQPGDFGWFVGYNPGIQSFETNTYYAHATNRFWQLLHDSGFTDRKLIPAECIQLREYGYGLIDLSMRPTVSSSDLTNSELAEGARVIIERAQSLQVTTLLANGMEIGRKLAGNPKWSGYGEYGLIDDTNITLWVLPSSSGRAGASGGHGMTYADKLHYWKLCATAMKEQKKR